MHLDGSFHSHNMIRMFFLVLISSAAALETLTPRLLNYGYDKGNAFSGTTVGLLAVKLSWDTPTMTRMVSTDGFGANEANFFCRKLGFPGGGDFTSWKDLDEVYKPQSSSYLQEFRNLKI